MYIFFNPQTSYIVPGNYTQSIGRTDANNSRVPTFRSSHSPLQLNDGDCNFLEIFQSGPLMAIVYYSNTKAMRRPMYMATLSHFTSLCSVRNDDYPAPPYTFEA